MKNILITLIILTKVFAWGGDGHRIIGGNSVYFFNESILQYKSWYNYLYNHSPDPDNRKNNDPYEGPKHYIDLDKIPEFNQYGYLITKNLDSLKLKYNYTNNQIDDIGILPWAILSTYDSLVNCFKRNDITKAQFFAADISHYIADAHMPLHLTKNYDGQYTNQQGIHSRYESNMISQYKNQINFIFFATHKINDIRNYTFEYIFNNFSYIDSVLNADNYAKSIDPYYGTNYYNALWNKTKNFTTLLWNKASQRIAEYIFSAYSESLSSIENQIVVEDFKLLPPYPNPFNPKINFTILTKLPQNITFEIYNLQGQYIETVYKGQIQSGYNNIVYNGQNLASGIYIYKIHSKNQINSGKIVLLK
ncbi:MAG TPA: T9SS type A sorting domain-containing protein [Ignavibacteriales bacterium]|nr:T9SS type A sorting domain-containing protein [Ignavibacteriales bacterium]HOL81188.1 T9SS type A sorting domain-containing protein [Ignavibacteriales bacterium]HOM65291.1 T9SS type A sorting domain-containing protein [Ignavibacteriales bacterium]HPD68121.1 T9SS type A sorting domain-containing protein [Ignavibacteriales bacterium]HPP33456.1 T9SS type A sorting domain-containing protein [Ignavibacteriales bacterium]